VKNRAYLSLGSNIEPEFNLPRAVVLLRGAGRLLAASSVYQTEPVGRRDQPAFLNAAILLLTDLTAAALKRDVIDPIENELGRVRDPLDKDAPRTIDIDISLWNDEVTSAPHRPIPDPGVVRFAHVAVPLAEIAPDYVHPVAGKTLAAIARGLVAGSPPAQLRQDVCLTRLIHEEPG
jgi:2-amino-4-hydroxy-6-hydroxymethyldihydropteridine diphosphokinase